MAEINSTSIDSLPVTIAEGGRNKALYYFGVRLKKEHQSPSTITDLMLQANKTHCNPPMEDDEINRIIRNSRHEAGHPKSVLWDNPGIGWEGRWVGGS